MYKYFLVFIFLTTQAFSSLVTEPDTEFSELLVEGMKTNLRNAQEKYNECCAYKERSMMPAELENIIERSSSLSRFPLEWKDRFVEHIVADFNASSVDFHLYSTGAKKAYINGLLLINKGLKSVYEFFKAPFLRENDALKICDWSNSAVDSDHWHRTEH